MKSGFLRERPLGNVRTLLRSCKIGIIWRNALHFRVILSDRIPERYARMPLSNAILMQWIERKDVATAAISAILGAVVWALQRAIREASSARRELRDISENLSIFFGNLD
jgi:hypothetical protein